MARINIKVCEDCQSDSYDGGGVPYLVHTPSNKIYLFYIDNNNDLMVNYSRNNGLTWNDASFILDQNGLIAHYSIWYDRWSDINSDFIHVVCGNSAGVYSYIRYNTLTDTVSSTIQIVDLPFGGFQSSFKGLSITRAKSGNLGVFLNFQDTFGGAPSNAFISRFYTSSNTGSTWSQASTPPFTSSLAANGILLPEFSSGDFQDMVMISQQQSNTSLLRLLYDNSANTWTTSSFGTASMNTTYNAGIPYTSAFPDYINSQSVIISWDTSNSITSNGKLQCFTITSSSITEKTPVITSSVGNIGLCGVSFNTLDNSWYAYYGGKSTGGENSSTFQVYYKRSTNQGTTWGVETPLTTDIPSIFNTQSFGLQELRVCPIVNSDINPIAFMPNSTGGSFGVQTTNRPYYNNTFFPTAGGSIVIS